MHAGITAITELAVKSGLTNRSPRWKTIPDYLEKAGWTVSAPGVEIAAAVAVGLAVGVGIGVCVDRHVFFRGIPKGPPTGGPFVKSCSQ
jgi:hypothetical protein